ncbi:MAG: ComF family protein [Candidatus Firestonebacteria bacterium]|nr:ComF family protein [Candidatus Firestonebacteria bacterium]
MRIFSWPRRLGLHALSLVSPPACPVCQKPLPRQGLSILCARCRPSLAPRSLCLRCGRELPKLAGLANHQALSCRFCRPLHPKFQGIISLAPYQGTWREAVLTFKSQPQSDLTWQLAHKIRRMVERYFSWKTIHAIVPVPARQNRETHPAYRLALNLSSISRRPCLPVLAFTKKVLPQRGLTRGERLRNMRRTLISRQPLHGQTVLVVDDVMTTGATVQECARALKNAGAQAVFAALLAQGTLE